MWAGITILSIYNFFFCWKNSDSKTLMMIESMCFRKAHQHRYSLNQRETILTLIIVNQFWRSKFSIIESSKDQIARNTWKKQNNSYNQFSDGVATKFREFEKKKTKKRKEKPLCKNYHCLHENYYPHLCCC